MPKVKKVAKCTGCRALLTTKGEFTCRLGYPISFKVLNTIATGPKPQQACPKPKTFRELKHADHAGSLD